jgi:CRISPR system Cascade subunit CasE
MYLSRVEIRPQLRATRSALSSPQKLHAIVAASFPVLTSDMASAEGDVRNLHQRHLWRLDKFGHSLYILVASAIKPDFAHLIEQLGWGASHQTWETKSYDPFLAQLRQGQEWRFRLRANPTRNKKQSGAPKGRGVVYPYVRIDDQKQWLETRAPKHGFALKNFELVNQDISKFRRLEETVTLHVATFEGTLRIEEPDLLREALISGIGRAKAYGCGLLTLARPDARA